jgi:3-dehydroquinate dehydratase/shikimate dehydrogenase
MGYYGSYTRILAERFGSHLSYSSPPTEKTAALGQIDTQELAELYRFREITKNTRIYVIIGNPLKSSVSPLFFNNIFRLENTDAVYVPFPVTSADEFMELADALDVQGLSVTAPYKEAVLPFLARKSAQVQSIGACNTMNLCEDGWYGENTDAPGFSGSILNFIGRKNLKWKKITIIGAGGVARAVASEISRLGGRAIIINRSVHKARAIALRYNLGWGGLDKNGVDLMNKHSDIIIQASSAGMEGNPSDDPLEIYSFSGRETVMDLIYTPEVTPFLRRAVQAGCKTINGYDMVIRQACLQYECFFSKEFPRHFLPMLDRSLNDAGEF